MTTSVFEAEMRRRLEAIEAQGLRRELRRSDSAPGARLELEGRPLINFSSNDYLGLADEPALQEAAIRAVERFGAGSGAARLICGSLAPHHELEAALAEFKGCEAALSFSSGYAAALGTITALAGRGDIVVIDRLVHASIVDAARLSGAKLRVFAHNDLDDLEKILKWTRAREVQSSTFSIQNSRGGRAPAVLIVTESVFSMDGDRAPLRELVELKERFGAWLMVDEAHTTGLFGARRRGLAEAGGVAERIEVQMGTLGKALGAAGGFIAGSRALIDYLVNRARSFIFSTAPVPAAAAAARAGVDFVRSDAGRARAELLWQRVREFTGVPMPPGAIVPVPIGGEATAVAVSEALRERGLFVPAIRHPTVARGAARLRVTFTARHSSADVEQLRAALTQIGFGGKSTGTPAH